MARASRVEYPGAFYHVINRGNAGDDIFKSPRDREKLFNVFTNCSRALWAKDSYLLSDDQHYHLLVETPEANLSRAIK